MKKTIVSTKRLMTLAVMMVMTILANAMSYNTAKPTPKVPVAKHTPAPAAKPNNNSAWRNVGSNRPTTSANVNGHSNANRQIAQNSNKTSHFGDRR